MTALVLGKPRMSSSWIVNFFRRPESGMPAISRQYPRGDADAPEDVVTLVLIEFPHAHIIDVRSRTLTTWKPT